MKLKNLKELCLKHLKHLLLKLLKLLKLPKYRPPIYGNKTLKVAFEFGTILSETAKGLGVELTSERVEKAEEIVIKELRDNGLKKTAINFIPLVTAMLEPKD